MISLAGYSWRRFMKLKAPTIALFVAWMALPGHTQGQWTNEYYVWHLARIENAWVVSNTLAGIRSGRNTSTNPPDTTTARITILDATVVGNANRQISLGDRGGYADARVLNTIAYSTANSQSEALEYNRSAPNFSMAWDWNVFYREGGGPVVVFGPNQSCSANQVPNCDGSHPNSIGAAPQFKDANWNYLREGSPGWDQGQRPSVIPQLSGIPIYRAETADHDGNARPYPAGGRYDIGAFEGPGGCAVMPRGGGLPLVMVGLGVMVALRSRRRSFSRWLSLHRLPLAPPGAICAPLLLTAFPSACIAAACLEGFDFYDDVDRRTMLFLSQQVCLEVYCGVTREGDRMYAELNDKVLFSGKHGLAGEVNFLNDLCNLLPSPDHGCELFVRSKFWGSQTLVKDINPGPKDGIAYCPQPIVIDDVVYFVANDGVHGEELWRSDGTSDGTWMVKDVNPGAGFGIPGVCRQEAYGDPSWVALGSVLIFVGFTPEHGYELWRSDGTEQGTWLVRDIWPGPRDGIECGDEDPVVPGFVVVGDKVLFKANDGVTGLEPWVTDGTPEGTRLLADTVPGSQLYWDTEEFLLGAFGDRRRHLPSPAHRCEGFINTPPFTVQNGLAFFTAKEVDPVTGGRVQRTWRTDGTSEGTYRVNQAPAADGGCAVAAGGVSAVSMFAGFALLLVLRRVHRR